MTDLLAGHGGVRADARVDRRRGCRHPDDGRPSDQQRLLEYQQRSEFVGRRQLNPHVAIVCGLSDGSLGTRMLEHLSWPHATGDAPSCDVPQPLLQAWNAVLREWDWRGPATLGRNLAAIRGYYRVGKGIS